MCRGGLARRGLCVGVGGLERGPRGSVVLNLDGSGCLNKRLGSTHR